MATFQQDIVQIQVTHTVQTFFLTQHIELLTWPTRSRDLSSIKHAWLMIGERLARRASPAGTPDEFWLRLEAA